MGVKTKTSLEKGHNRGRPKGSINRVTLALKDDLESRGFIIVEKLIDLYQNGDFNDKDRLRIVFKIMEYTHPKLKEREVNEAGEPVESSPTQINITMTDLIKAAKGSEEE